MKTATQTLHTSQWLQALQAHKATAPSRIGVDNLQINLGYYCNLACVHCHVEASPKRVTEVISPDTVNRIKAWMELHKPSTLDLTGGAPELISGFRDLVIHAHSLGMKILDRNNLTCFFEPGQEDLVDFLREHKVTVVASMPCYSLQNVDKQRGQGTFDKSIEALQLLNQAGYGQPDSGLELMLVYNPLGASLPPEQSSLEASYRVALREHFKIEFNSLWCITNMPVTRFSAFLERQGKLQGYKDLLLQSFNPTALHDLMCRDTLSVDYHGHVYDCDFNQILGLPLSGSPRKTLWDLRPEDVAKGSEIAFRNHCLGCTAGAGSSCGGALQES